MSCSPEQMWALNETDFPHIGAVVDLDGYLKVHHVFATVSNTITRPFALEEKKKNLLAYIIRNSANRKLQSHISFSSKFGFIVRETKEVVFCFFFISHLEIHLASDSEAILSLLLSSNRRKKN